ncbi:MAG TPA: hypothetical protein V6D28_04355 [Leptolyngbyaceae cyanobacterium]
MPSSKIYCFRASYELSTNFDRSKLPDWLRLAVDWQGYRLWTVPEVADVARILGALEIEEDSPSLWICHLESLGLRNVRQVFCEDLFEARGYS